MKKKLAKEKPGLNSWDYGDQGSQEVAESAEQMYRSQSQPTRAAQTRQDSTKSKVVLKAKKTDHEGLDIMEHGNEGIYSKSGQKRYTTNKTTRKITNQARHAVAPPGNPMDVGKRVAKSSALSSLEALNLGVQLDEKMETIHKSGRPDCYNELMSDFVETINTYADVWFSGSSITKSKDTDKQAEDIAARVLNIISKASPSAESSDDASEGKDADDVDNDSNNNNVGKLKSRTVGNNENEKEQTVVGKNKKTVFKSLLKNDPFPRGSERRRS